MHLAPIQRRSEIADLALESADFRLQLLFVFLSVRRLAFSRLREKGKDVGLYSLRH